MGRLLAVLPLWAACAGPARTVAPEDVAVRTGDEALLIVGDSEPVARILLRDGYPLLVQQLMAPGARNVLRPDLADESRPAPAGTTRDHPHQRGARVAHGDVNGHHLWEGEGTIEVTSHNFDLPLEGGVRVEAHLEWRGPDRDLLCTEDRIVTVRPFTDRRELDVEIQLSATGNAVTFGDEKDGFLGLRLADPFQLNTTGRALDSEGRKDGELWGKSARWVAYAAPLADRKGEAAEVTVAFFDHPENPRYPTRWHARPYGLVAANPFGLSAFDGDRGRRGDLRLASYEKLTFKYRIVVATAPLDTSAIEAWCADFTGLSPVESMGGGEPGDTAPIEVTPDASEAGASPE